MVPELHSIRHGSDGNNDKIRKDMRLRRCSHSFTDSVTNKETIKRLNAASILCLIFIIVEVIGGMLSSSLAVLSDAAHLFADLASFIVAIIAARLARLPPNSSNTFGFHRAEALAALYSMSCLWIVSLFLGIEACRRGYNFLILENEGVVNGKIMSITATVGVIVNICLAFILGGDHHHHGHGDHSHDHSHNHSHDHPSKDDNNHGNNHENNHCNSHSHEHSHEKPVNLQGEEATLLLDEENQKSYRSVQSSKQTSGLLDDNLNLKAAYLHVLADLLQSFCVLVSGLVIWYNPDWQIFDPIVTILFCIFVMKTTYGVIISSISILMNEVPSKVDLDAIYAAIENVEGVTNVHDLHVWSITHGSYSLSVHAVTDDVDLGIALEKIHRICKGFGIGHCTIQLQPTRGDQSCVTCNDQVVTCLPCEH